MSNTLVIVESPAKCKKIESYLGSGYKVVASFGHLRNIPNLESIDLTNDFSPKYSIIDDKMKLKQIEKLRSEISNASNVIIATDDDREGEAIGWHICDLFGLSVSSTKRIIFHEISESAIQQAIINPTTLNMNLVNAQQSRAVLDMLVGFIISPILWKNINKKYDKGLSAGRCQTPALRIIYDNYLDIQKTAGNLVYNTTGYFTNLHLQYELNKQFKSQEEINEFYELCKNGDFLCNNTLPKKNIKQSPEPLTTSKLQQLASNELHLSPKETMKYAQELYENGFITYMRTDNTKYSNEFVSNIKIYIEKNYGPNYINSNIDNLIVGINVPVKDKKNKKKTINNEIKQEAHEAIRPVSINIQLSNDKSVSLHPKSIKLYNLIRKRTLESCMSSAQYNTITSKIFIIKTDNELYFSYKTEQIIFAGWLAVENKYEKDSPTYNYISNLKPNIKIMPTKIDIKFTMIDLKSHYSEARLVQILEEKGIGRPSTFAMLIDKIQERGYVQKQNIDGKTITNNDYIIEYQSKNITMLTNETTREFGNEKNKLVIQPIGIIVIEFLINHFNDFFNYDYTKYMENELDLIAKGEKVWCILCKECYDNLVNITKHLQENKFELKIDDNNSLIIGKYGPVIKNVSSSNNISFIKVKKDLDISKLREIEHIKLEDIIDNTVQNKDAIGKYKGHDLFIKKGKYGLYAEWGNERETLKELGSNSNITYEEVLRYLEKDKMLDPTKPVGLVRELTNNLSIRTGKYGDYIFYKKPRAKKPEFLKLNGFNGDYKKCDKNLLVNWIVQTYNIVI
jgi:DNA topoisomerase-1